ncbi:hypothetical protein JF66_19945 [Cryobacterium sp. MLB-32]|uniref:hypothetical protein n=1 Tax=Cryobacterium sp. MLB-32 TaxID=1529318 RepID=UPI0004E6E187|nr:hypothetical protein [Cryobacterium sp. MLB-32]KFF58251.1 hypothetical protein JF66_19945 [Cryobacterium sp. MLB-32]
MLQGTVSAVICFLNEWPPAMPSAFGNLYDAFVVETYAICLHNLANPSAADKAMVRTWIFIWSHAAALNDQAGSTQSIVLSTAWAVTSQHHTRPL